MPRRQQRLCRGDGLCLAAKGGLLGLLLLGPLLLERRRRRLLLLARLELLQTVLVRHLRCVLVAQRPLVHRPATERRRALEVPSRHVRRVHLVVGDRALLLPQLQQLRQRPDDGAFGARRQVVEVGHVVQLGDEVEGPGAGPLEGGLDLGGGHLRGEQLAQQRDGLDEVLLLAVEGGACSVQSSSAFATWC